MQRLAACPLQGHGCPVQVSGLPARHSEGTPRNPREQRSPNDPPPPHGPPPPFQGGGEVTQAVQETFNGHPAAAVLVRVRHTKPTPKALSLTHDLLCVLSMDTWWNFRHELKKKASMVCLSPRTCT